MKAEQILSQILSEIKKTNTALAKIDMKFAALDKKILSIDKRIGGLEKNMQKVLECVSTENAAEFPSVKRHRGGGVRNTASIAAKAV